MLTSIAAAALLVTPVLAAPWTNATCIDLLWSINSYSQNPCLVTSYLESQCTSDNTFGVPALNVSGAERGPYGFRETSASICVCNSVSWNLISACALCQKGLAGSWLNWVALCPTNLVTVGKYPIPLPTGVSVPSWAYIDFTTAGQFDPVIASQHKGLESAAVIAPSSSPTPALTPTQVTPSTSTPTAIKSESRSTSNTGAIVGGVIGGILAIGLIGLIAFVLVRKQKHEASTTDHPRDNLQPPMTAQSDLATRIPGYPPTYQSGAPNQSPSATNYDPYKSSDPSAFATNPTTPTGGGGYHPEQLPFQYNPQGTTGQQHYSGTPQV